MMQLCRHIFHLHPENFVSRHCWSPDQQSMDMNDAGRDSLQTPKESFEPRASFNLRRIEFL